jgi:hypothetical protein
MAGRILTAGAEAVERTAGKMPATAWRQHHADFEQLKSNSSNATRRRAWAAGGLAAGRLALIQAMVTHQTFEDVDRQRHALRVR